MKKWFENLKISKKLVIGFLSVSFLGIVVGIIGIINMASMARNQQQTYENCTLGIEYSSKAEAGFLKLRTAINGLYIFYQNDKEKYCNEITTQMTEIETQMNNYKKTIANKEDQAYYDAMVAAYEPYKKSANEVLKAAKDDRTQIEVITLVTSAAAKAQKATTAFENIGKYNDTLALANLQGNKTSATIAIFIMVVVLLLSYAAAMLLSFYISKLISKPLNKLATVGEMLAVGDLDVYSVLDEKDRLYKYRGDEVGALALSFFKMIASNTEQAQKMSAIAGGDLTAEITLRSEADVLGKALRELVEKLHALASSIVLSADQVDSGARQVADSSTSLSQGATEQASSVEELTASLEEVTSETTRNAQSAQMTNELARNIKKDAEAGNAQMTEMLRAMDEINVSSDNIGKIIKVIENIAFQTNILALNAAVEAARAGQYGRGFAVVAEEVRNLAGQSAKAAKETTDLIGSSIKKVEAGTKIANETAEALNKIVTEIAKVSEHIEAIATASNGQSAALNQINQGVLQVSQIVQSNAASSEECAASSEELSSQANALKESVSVFKLKAEDSVLMKPESGSPDGQQTEQAEVQAAFRSNLGKY